MGICFSHCQKVPFKPVSGEQNKMRNPLIRFPGHRAGLVLQLGQHRRSNGPLMVFAFCKYHGLAVSAKTHQIDLGTIVPPVPHFLKCTTKCLFAGWVSVTGTLRSRISKLMSVDNKKNDNTEKVLVPA